MTPTEAIEIARLKAEKLNYPWNSEAAVAKRWGILPGCRNWRVVSHVQNQNFTVTMNVFERSREADLVRAVWATNEPAPVKPGLVLLFAFKLLVCGGIVWWLERYPAHQPVWHATLVAIPGAFAGVIFYELLVARINLIRTRNYILKKRADQQKRRRTSRETKSGNNH